MDLILWYIYFAGLIAGSIFSIVGFIKFRDSFKSKNWFFAGALSFITPPVLTLIFYIVDRVSSSSEFYVYQLPSGFIFYGLIVIAALLLVRFVGGRAEDRTVRNATLGCSGFLFIQLLVLLYFFTIFNIYTGPRKYEDFTYEVEFRQITITDYSGKEKTVEIPSVIDEKSVTKIGRGAFNFTTSMTKVVIPDGVTSIGEYAFWHCEFLTDINIPDSVESIDGNPFNDCGRLTEINVSSGSTNFSSAEGILYSKDKRTVIACPAGKNGSIQVPDTVTHIGENAFSGCSQLTGITIPESVTNIGKDAFWDCQKLVIYCREDSYAHRYAVDHQIEFVLDE